MDRRRKRYGANQHQPIAVEGIDISPARRNCTRRARLVQIATARSTIKNESRAHARARSRSSRCMAQPTKINRAFSKLVDVKPNELRALLLRFLFHFLSLTGYYIMRPIRDSIAAGNRLETLPWMFTATLVAMLIANALFAAIVARMSRRKFIPLAYGFFIFNLALFFFLMRSSPPAQQVWIGRALYVWVSVFNLFNTAIFWAFMTDLFTVEQGKRLYGFIAVGGSLGGVLGPYITARYVQHIGPANLLVVSAIMFVVAGFLVRFFPSGFTDTNRTVQTQEEPIGGSIWSGI